MGLSAKETMLLPVGALYDQWELHLQAHGIEEKAADDM